MRYLLMILGIASIMIAGCTKNQKDDSQGEVVFSFQKKMELIKGADALTGSSGETGIMQTEAASVMVSIEDGDGYSYYFNDVIDMHGSLGSQVSEPLGLAPGNYKLVDFIVLDNEGAPLYVCPKSDSKLAYLVSAPLPLEFEVRANSVEKVVPEVITAEGDLDAYGYTTESFDVVETIDFYVSVFSENSGEMEFTPTILTVTDATCKTDALYSGELGGKTEFVRVRKTSSYVLNFVAEGYDTTSMTLTAEELAQYAQSPLVVVLEPETGTLLLSLSLPFAQTLQPRAAFRTVGIEAEIPELIAAELSASNDVERMFALVTVEKDGTVLLKRQQVALQKNVNNSEVTWQAELDLEAGNYEITELFVMREGENPNRPFTPIAAVPLSGSALADQSETPLPISVTVQANQGTSISPDALQTDSHSAIEFGYDKYPEIVTFFTRVAPRYQSTSSTSYCLPEVAMEVSVCSDIDCSEKDWVDLCELYSAYRGTEVYESMCPKWTEGFETPHLTAKVHSVNCKQSDLPLIAVPDGYQNYRIHAKKWGYEAVSKVFTRTEIGNWDDTKTVTLQMNQVETSKIGISHDVEDGDVIVTEQLLYDDDGFFGKPDVFDAETGMYPVTRLPTTVDFGVMKYGETVTKTITVTNKSEDTNLVLSDILIVNDGDTSDQNPAFVLESESELTIEPGDSSVLTVSFQYNVGDEMEVDRSATLVIPHNDAYVVDISGSAAAEVSLTAKVEHKCSPEDSDDHNVCTDDKCVPDSGWIHVNNKVACNDGNACTTNDVCSEGECTSGAALSCDDGNICTDNTCDPNSGCVFAPNSVSCDDGNACTVGDVCSAGQCTGGGALSCDDGNICTNDSCDPRSGCVFAPNSVSCDDGNACTVGDVCSAGQCTGGGALSCDDGNICTNDSCDPRLGCAFAPNSVYCDDGNVRTFGDVCLAGKCNGGAELEPAVSAAIFGPELKNVNINGHEFNVKKASIEQSGNRRIVTGVISHRLTLRPDDQVDYRIVIENNAIAEDGIEREIDRGGLAPIVGGLGTAVGAYFLVPIHPSMLTDLTRSIANAVEGDWTGAADALIYKIAFAAASM